MRCRWRGLLWALLSVSWVSVTASAAPPEKLEFPGLDKWNGAEPLALAGYWYRAEGAARLPAIVMLHGCSGAVTKSGKIAERFAKMAAHLNQAGYHVLLVDSFNPRGAREICTVAREKRAIKARHRLLDAYSALIYLSGRHDVVPDKIGAIGFSHGATAAVQVVDRTTMAYRDAGKQFAASVAMYPGCSDVLKQKPPFTPYAPLLVLAGALDDWTPAEPCERLVKRHQGGTVPLAIVIYPDAYHAFDSSSPVKVRNDVWGGKKPVHVGANPQARADAYRRIPEFFAQHLTVTPNP